MERKYKIRIVFAAVVLAAALLFVGIISGFFGYLFRGYKAFFKKDVYTVRQVYVPNEYKVSVSDDSFTVETTSLFSNQKIMVDVVVAVEEKNGEKQITLTFKNDYSIAGGVLLSGLCLEDARRKDNAPFDDLKRTTEVFLLDGDRKTQCELSSYTAKRKTVKMCYTVSGDVKVDKIFVSGFWLTESERK